VAAPAFVPAFNWTGLYVGGEIGGGWAHQQGTLNTGNRFFPAGFEVAPLNASGVLGGAVLGYNYQYGPLVLGVEGTYDWGDLHGSATTQSPLLPISRTETVNGDWLATVSGRAGYAWNNVLVYGKGGAGWGAFSSGTTTVVDANDNVLRTVSGEGNAGNARWLAGAGVEWGFWKNWTLKAEYNYLGGTHTVSTENESTGFVTTRTSTGNIQVAKVGVNYLFNWPTLPTAFH
jgi:outer membrane immunogenic protein